MYFLKKQVLEAVLTIIFIGVVQDGLFKIQTHSKKIALVLSWSGPVGKKTPIAMGICAM